MLNLTPYRRHNEPAIFNPFRELEDFERSLFAPDSLASFRTDIEDAGDKLILSADLPGFKKEDIKVELKDGYLTVTAQKNLDKEEHKGKKILRQERYSGSCSRTFYIGDVKAEDVKGKYDAGVLTLEFPKEDQRKLEEKRSISIE